MLAKDITDGLKSKYIDGSDNPIRRDDYRKVWSFGQLKGRPSLPIDQYDPRSKIEFEKMLSRLEGMDFFEPFNEVLELIGAPRVKVEPSKEVIDSWNKPGFVGPIVAEVCDCLDSGRMPRLVPKLVAAFWNLEREVPVREWEALSAITVPGSRTFDRAAEAFRAYVRSKGKAMLITSGRTPYYDNNNVVQLTESEANAAYLRLLGVPAEQIIIEATSRDTAENVEFLTGAFQRIKDVTKAPVRNVLLVTSPFHLARYRLSVETIFDGQDIHVFALGSKASRYWAETYFLTDSKSGYTREATMETVFNEYMKIAFDVCAQRRAGMKSVAKRGPNG